MATVKGEWKLNETLNLDAMPNLTTAERLAQVAENVPKVYEAGKQAESEAFWNGVTNFGDRESYARAFLYWSAEYLRPNRKIMPITGDSGVQTFSHNPKLKKVEAAYFDFSQKPKASSESYSYYYTFYNCSKLEEVEDIGLQAEIVYHNTFASCPKLHTIAKVRSDENTKFNSSFASCTALKNISFDGVIGQTINFAYCGELSAESIRNIFEHLSDEASGKTLYLRSTAVNASKTNGEYYFSAYANGSEFFTANPITLYPGQTIKVTWEIEDGHDYYDHADGDWWFGFCQDSVEPSRENGWTYTATEGTEELSPRFCFAAGNSDALGKRVKIKAVKIDTDSGEEYSDNLVTSLTSNGSSAWAEKMFDYWSRMRSNWTISY